MWVCSLLATVRDIIKKASDTSLRCSFLIGLKRMDHYWSNTERRKKSLVKDINSNNPCNQQSRVHRKITARVLRFKRNKVRQRLEKILLLKNPIK